MQTSPNLSSMTREELEAFARAAALRIEEAESRAAEAERRAADLERRVAQLEALMREPPKSSGNSSLPPSKDFKANKKATERSGPRKGSLGREGSHRRLCENPDEIVRVMAKRCGRCQAELDETEQTFKCAWDKVDIPRVKPVVTRVEIYEGRCPCCQAQTKPACVPEGCEPGSPFSLTIVALALYLRVTQNISFERLARLFRDLFGLVISEGAINAMLKRAKPGFDAEVAVILARLRKSRLVYSDETGVRVAGKGWWNWVFGNAEIVLHVIRPSRSREVVDEVLGGHRPAIWVSDLLSSQQGHAAEWQICLAHQLRDCQYAIDAGDAVFAPPMKRLFLRAFVIARRRENLADFDLARLQGQARTRTRRHHGVAGPAQGRPAAAQALRQTPRLVVHLPRSSRRRAGQQSLRTQPASHGDLPQSHRRLPVAVGARPLRRRPFRHCHCRPQRHRRLRRHPKYPRRVNLLRRGVSSYSDCPRADGHR